MAGADPGGLLRFPETGPVFQAIKIGFTLICKDSDQNSSIEQSISYSNGAVILFFKFTCITVKIVSQNIYCYSLQCPALKVYSNLYCSL